MYRIYINGTLPLFIYLLSIYLLIYLFNLASEASDISSI